MPLTVVIPTYGRPRFVAEAVDSVLAQTAPAEQVLVVADGPDPRVRQALADRPVTVLEIPHGGVAAARNAGVAQAMGSWVCFLDDDDLLHRDYIASARAYLAEHPTAAALNAGYWTFASAPRPDVDLVADSLAECLAQAEVTPSRTDLRYLEITGRSFDLLLERLRGSMSTAWVRRDLLLQAGGFPSGRTCAEDWAMYVNVARFAEWHVVPRRLAFFRDHVSTNTRTGGTRNGLDTLRAIQEFWTPQHGWPQPPPHRPLSAYRHDYRYVLRGALDAARRDREVNSYLEALRIAGPILPRPADRLTAMIPAPLWSSLRSAREGVWRLFPHRASRSDAVDEVKRVE